MNRFNPEFHHRHSIRLRGYDYSQKGTYYVTICTFQRNCIFGEIVDGKVDLSDLGHIVENCWLNLSRFFPNVELDVHIVMPNHLHGIIIIANRGKRRGEAFAKREFNLSKRLNANASPLPPDGTQRGSLGAIIQNFKSISSRKINLLYNTPGASLWQRNYYEHIIRNERELTRIREYIKSNPANWLQDENHPENLKNEKIT